MKTSPSSLAVLVLLCALPLLRPAPAAALETWLAPNGSDLNPGSSNAPLATLGAALEKWKHLPGDTNTAAGGELTILLRAGVYPLTRTVQIQPQAFSPGYSRLIIEAAPGDHPILNGGAAVGHWKRFKGKLAHLPEPAYGHVWVADAPKIDGQVLEFRQLWVNNQKATRAREPNNENLARLVAWDKTNQVATIPATALAGIKEAGQLEMVIDQVWEIAMLRVETIRYDGSNALIHFKQPEGRIEFHHPWPPVTVNTKYQAPFFLANAIEFLDEPGEWFEDVPAGKIYYWPRADEDMTTAAVFAPANETLLHIEGTTNAPATHIQFKGITFAYTTWLRPSQAGHIPLQAGMFLLDAKKLSPKGMPYHPGLDNLAWIGRPPAAVLVKNAGDISFEGCTFEHLASAGLDFDSGAHNDSVRGCVFQDIGGNGIQLGKFSDTNVETHVPYEPSNDREICAHESISDNVISDCGNEDWGCVGIGVGYAQNITIEHNEVFNLPYTGISVGWGWTKMTNALNNNLIRANYVHGVGQKLGDLGSIYLLSAQPGTVVAENSVSDMKPGPFVPDPNHWFYLYLDEGSSFITVRDNWCPAERFLKNANGPGNVWTNNGPQVSESIKNAAGLEPEYQNHLPLIK